MSMMENTKMSEDELKQIAGGNYGGGGGQWAAAMVKAPGGLCKYTKSGKAFVKNAGIFIPNGEYITVDRGRIEGKYAIAFYNNEEGWVDTSGLEWI